MRTLRIKRIIQMSKKEKLIRFYDKNYKKFLIIPALLILLSLSYLVFFYYQNGDIIYKDVSLTGGTTITFLSEILPSELEAQLSQKLSDVSVSAVSDNTGKQTSLLVTSTQDSGIVKQAIEEIVNHSLDESNSSIEFTGSSLGRDFYNQLMRAVIFAFILMALVVFVVFGESKKIKAYSLMITLITARLTFPLSIIISIMVFIAAIAVFGYLIYLSKAKKEYYTSIGLLALFIIIFFYNNYLLIIPLFIALMIIYTYFSVPSIAVILSAFADIIMPLAIIDLMGMKISSAGIVAFLMLIGYSVDTDILLTTRVLRRGHSESVNKTTLGAFKTGITMTLTSIAAILVALVVVYQFNSILNQIFIILAMGLAFDTINTWLTNVCLIKWYAERK